MLALPLALVLYDAYCPYIRRIIGDDVELSVWGSPSTMVLLVGITILVGIFSGSYPALFLSRFNPVQILKGKTGTGSRGRLRKFLVVFQFSMSIVFIAFALTVKKQSDYAFDVNPGYDGKDILAVYLPADTRQSQRLLSEEMSKNSTVLSVSASMNIPGGWRGAPCEVVREGSDESSALKMDAYGVQHDFTKLMGMRILSGRDFAGDERDESSFIINRMAAERLGWETPIGRTITMGTRSGSVIGVVDDFLLNSLSSPRSPGILYIEKEKLSYLLVKASRHDMIPSIESSLTAIWKKRNPDVPFNAATLDEYLIESEEGRQKASVVLGAIGVAAIFFSSLGLFGLVSYSVRQRTKEIGVRKVLGASMGEIVVLLGRNFMFLVVVSNLIGLPIAYAVSQLFLTRVFAVHPSLGAGMFILVSSVTFLAAATAIAFQLLKGARSDPVESLRYE
ncbi:MAG: FtsX-like permease family protein [Acidobacteriota bacterium]